MNSPRFPRSGRWLLGISGFLIATTAILADTDDVPRGSLSVDRDMVRVGVRSQLEWNIEYPSGITELIEIIPPNRIVPKKNLRMKIRVLGVAFQSGKTLLPLDGYWSKNDSTWKRIFYGTGPEVQPSKVMVDADVKKGDIIDFGARGWSRSWLPFHHTRKTDKYVTVLVNGDTAPDYTPAYNQKNIESFLKPYLSGDRINIGERDVIILWEASTAKPGSHYFDMQDLVILVTFE